MYEQYWNLACRPFDDRPDQANFFAGDMHQAALLKLHYLVENGLHCGVLCGGIGSGKTRLAMQLPHLLGPAFAPVVHVVFPQMAPAEFLSYLAAKLGDEATAVERLGVDQVLQQIENRLRQFAQQGQRPIILIDEAHLIEDPRLFDCLHLLLNLVQTTGCEFSLIFVGATMFLGRLERMAQLNDRVAVRCTLDPLNREETRRYVIHRLAAAKATREIFQRAAFDAIAERSGGVPRRINRLCDLALLVGYADQLKTIGANEVHGVAEELPPAIAA